MKLLCVYLFVIIVFGFASFGKGEIYIVTVEGEPIISYKGGVDGFEATAVESDDDRVDSSRYIVFCLLLLIFLSTF